MDASSAHQEGAREQLSAHASPREGVMLTVRQPEKIRSLLLVLDDLERIAERVGEDHSHDLGAGGTPAGGAQGAQDGTQGSLRQQAIQALPPVPLMQRRLVSHLQREIRQLEREARRTAWKLRRGGAHALNRIFAHIRKIQALIADILDAAADVIERLYIRLFIDHQQLV